MSPPRRRGLAAETPFWLGGSLLLFVALATFTVISYKFSIDRLVDERRAEAARWAERLVDVARRPAATLESVARAAPPGAAVALLDAQGRATGAVGFEGSADWPLADAPLPARPFVSGPGESRRESVVAVVPFGAEPATRRYLRLELPARALAAQQRSLAVLVPTVVGLSIAAAILLVLVSRALIRPYQELLQRARAAGTGAGDEDEIDFLVGIFDRALEALAAARGGEVEAIQSALGRQIESGFLLLDREGRLLAANPMADALLGGLPATGAPLAETFARHAGIRLQLEQAIARGERIARGEARVGGAEARTVGLVAEPLRSGGANPRGWLILLADVTELERKAAAERMAEGLAQLGELAAGVAHELRNSVATLAGYLELARRHRPEPRLEADLVEIERELGRTRRVVEDFLLFARPGARRVEAIDLAELVARAARDPGFASATIELVDGSCAMPASGDAEMLERATRDLLRNAVEAEAAVGRRGPIVIRLHAGADEHRIEIADRGPGLPAELSGRLFDPFVSGKPGGAGLGLSLARRIVVLHGGSLELENRPDGGACARIRLPARHLDTDGNATLD